MTSSSVDDFELLARVERFAAELHDTVAAVLPGEPGPFVVRRTPDEVHDVSVRQSPDEGIPLTVDGHVVLRQFLRYRCAWDHTRGFVAVRWSSLSVAADGFAEPLFRYDYDESSDGKVPAAHLNVHGHRDELVFAMIAAGHRFRGRSRAASVRRGRVPRVSTLHFPLGGHRFRPALEDVLEMVVREFGLDARDGWEGAIRAGRERWRDVQLRAAVRDDPAAATAALLALGYAVTPPRVLPEQRGRTAAV
ncbi:hypothetical protein [Cellulomonas hominis]|uniref:hypothetical protein n=1 Tax=Cellulomonas hominis TaxID=156981 RepID=UPI001B950552|nr:hypothetical protein [Cellulomonas hominis]VTR77470.1 hypothetical protein CHMI_02239 [Cellulomonas hominis]